MVPLTWLLGPLIAHPALLVCPALSSSISGGRRASRPSELHSRTIKAHSFNEKVPLAGPGFLGVRAPITHSYSSRHSEDWPRPASCHAFLWTLCCNPHT